MATGLTPSGNMAPEAVEWIRTVVAASGFAGARAGELSAELQDHLESALTDHPVGDRVGAATQDTLRAMGDPARLGRRLARQRLGRELRNAMHLPSWARALLAVDLAVLGPWFVASLPPGYDDLPGRLALVVLEGVAATLVSWALLGLGGFGVRLLRAGPRRASAILLGAGTLLSAIAAWFIVCLSAVANAVAQLLERWPVRHRVESGLFLAGVALTVVALGLMWWPMTEPRARTSTASTA